MHIFAKKPKATPQTRAPKPAKLGRKLSGQSPDVPSILHLQRMIGNQAVARLLQSDTEDGKASPVSNAEVVQTRPLITRLVQRQAEEEEAGSLQAKEVPGPTPEVTPEVQAGAAPQLAPPEVQQSSVTSSPQATKLEDQSHVTTGRAWLVSNPTEWEDTHFDTLDVGVAIDVVDLAQERSFNKSKETYHWWKVTVRTGPSKGTVGWIMRSQLKEDRTSAEDEVIEVVWNRLVGKGEYYNAIDHVILEYAIDQRGAEVKWNPRLSAPGRATGDTTPMFVSIGPNAFTSLSYLARVLIHEFEHIRQFQAHKKEGGAVEDYYVGGDHYNIGQFLAECAEMTTTGVIELTFEEFMNAAEMASAFWFALSETPEGIEQQVEHWDTFEKTREVIEKRFIESDPDSRTEEHRGRLRWWQQEEPPPQPPPPP